MTRHDLKAWPGQFDLVLSGAKTFELRRDDRGYTYGDQLLLREWDPATEEYTGRTLAMHVSHILRGAEAMRFGLRLGYCVLSLRAEPPPEDVQGGATPDAAIPPPVGVCPTCMGEQVLPTFTSDPVIRGDRIVQSGAELRACPQCGGRSRFDYQGPSA